VRHREGSFEKRKVSKGPRKSQKKKESATREAVSERPLGKFRYQDGRKKTGKRKDTTEVIGARSFEHRATELLGEERLTERVPRGRKKTINRKSRLNRILTKAIEVQ